MDNQPQTNFTPPPTLDQQMQPAAAPVVAAAPATKKLSKPSLIIGSILVVLLMGATTIMVLKQTNINAPVATTQPVKTNKSTTPLSPVASNPKAIDDASLQTDLSSVSSSSNLDASNLSTTDNNLNDQQQQIAVPTN